MRRLYPLLFTLGLGLLTIINSLAYAYAFDDVLTNNTFNATKAWNVVKAEDRPIDCGTIFYNPVVENLKSTSANLSATYAILVDIYNNHSNDDLSETYYHDLYNTLTNMRYKLDELQSDINNRTDYARNFRVETNCAGFNMAYELFKGYEEANRTYPNNYERQSVITLTYLVSF